MKLKRKIASLAMMSFLVSCAKSLKQPVDINYCEIFRPVIVKEQDVEAYESARKLSLALDVNYSTNDSTYAISPWALSFSEEHIRSLVNHNETYEKVCKEL